MIQGGKKKLSDCTSVLHSRYELLFLECCIYTRHVFLSGSLASSVMKRIFQQSLLGSSLANVSLAFMFREQRFLFAHRL